MAIVGGLQLAHGPILPGVIAFQRGNEVAPEAKGPLEGISPHFPHDAEIMEDMRRRFVELEPDVIVFFDSDHLNTFFLDHVPSIAVGVGHSTSGPSDHPLGHPHYAEIPLDHELGDHLHRALVEREFDASRAQRFTLDHSTTVPLHFLTPEMDVPVVPIWINGLGGVPIRSQRARALGEAVRDALEASYPERRIVLVSSGAVSLDIGTPRIYPGAVFGLPDPDWLERATSLIGAGNLDDLVAEATLDQLRRAGNTSAELLNLIALMAALGDAGPPDTMTVDRSLGHAYAAWKA